MCIICVDLDNGKLDPWEASKNRVEFLDILDEEHLQVLDTKIREALVKYLDDISRSNLTNNECDE